MNYDKAREIPDKGWHWTTMNDRVIRTAWPCVRLKEGVTLSHEFGLPPYDPDQWERCEPHATAEEATRHWYAASLAELHEETYGDWMGCQAWLGMRPDGSAIVCDLPTKGGLGNRGMAGAFSGNALCEQHRTPEVVAALNPFHAGLEVIHS